MRSTFEPAGSLSSSWVRRVFAAIVAFAIATVTAVAMTPPAQAATPGITPDLLLNGESYNDTDVVTEGDTVTLRVQYDHNVGAGTAVTFDIGGAVGLAGVPDGNTAVESFEQDGNTVTVTFKDPWPDGINQGVFDLDFTVNEVEGSTPGEISWTVDGEQNSIDVIVRDDGDNFANVNAGAAKNLAGADLNQYVSVTDGEVTVDPALADQDLNYTLRLDSETARSGYDIADTLPEAMAYDESSFDASITTWDENGLNEQAAGFLFNPDVSGNSFSTTVDVPGTDARDADGPSVLDITYTAHITDVEAIQEALQEQYDELEGEPGDFSTSLENTATFGSGGPALSRTAQAWIGGTVTGPPGPNPGSAFSKSGNWQYQQTPAVNVAEDGTLDTPLEIDYSFRAYLDELIPEDSEFTLDQNVVISDTLPSQGAWDTGDSEFISAEGTSLEKAPDCPSVADFAADAYVGQYCVDGQTLLINLGQDVTTHADISAKAQINSVDGLPEGGDLSAQDATGYQFRNVAEFDYRDEGEPETAGWTSYPVVLPETDGGYNDSDVFTKTGSAEDTKVDPGESTTVNYTFALTGGHGIDVTQSRIVDYLDTEIFDLSDLSAVDIAGSYNGQALTQADFALSTNAEGNLVIELSDSGEEVVQVQGTDKDYVVDLSLTTVPFEGKETKTITNKATLVGDDDEPLYWSSTESEATSYGDEAEVRKRVYDRNAEEGTNHWVETLQAYRGQDGDLLNDTFVYRVEFIPHGNYDQVKISDVDDTLPEGVQFLGFVGEADAATGANPTSGPIDIGGNLESEYDAASDTVTLQQKDGTKLDAGGDIAAYFAVQITDDSAPIVNEIGSTSAKIDPQDPPSIDVEKWTAEAESSGPTYDDSGALTNDGYDGDFDESPGKPLEAGSDQPVEFTISNDGGEALTDIEVSDELTAGENAVEDLVCTFPDESTGTAWDGPFQPADQFTCAGTLPGLAAGEAHADEVTVTAVGIASEDEVTDSDEWNGYAKSYAVGDYVWIDTNKDGVQDSDEDALPGVSVELLEESGDVVATTTTDDEGRYLFDGLAAGDYQVRFTLTEEQADTYQFTQADAGEDDAVDSDADPATGLTEVFTLDESNDALTSDYDREFAATQGIDPTWDAGVNLLPDPTPTEPGEQDSPSEPEAGGTDNPSDPGTADGDSTSEPEAGGGFLPDTGTTIGIGVIAAILALLGTGGALLAIRRHRSLG